MTGAALDLLKATANDFFATQAGFGPNELAASFFAADDLRALFLPLARGPAAAPSARAPPPAML